MPCLFVFRAIIYIYQKTLCILRKQLVTLAHFSNGLQSKTFSRLNEAFHFVS